jgi:hypothetical protein
VVGVTGGLDAGGLAVGGRGAVEVVVGVGRGLVVAVVAGVAGPPAAGSAPEVPAPGVAVPDAAAPDPASATPAPAGSASARRACSAERAVGWRSVTLVPTRPTPCQARRTAAVAATSQPIP